MYKNMFTEVSRKKMKKNSKRDLYWEMQVLSPRLEKHSYYKEMKAVSVL